MKRPSRCPILVTAAVVGISAVAIALVYFWSQKKKKTSICCKSEASKPSDVEPTSSTASSVSTASGISEASEPRQDAGRDMESSETSSDMFRFSDENVRKVCEKLFLEQMDLGESYLEDEETAERGAMHMANAITLTGETDQLLKVLRKSVTPVNFSLIQKYIPTADVRVSQLLQDELTVEAIAENFG